MYPDSLLQVFESVVFSSILYFGGLGVGTNLLRLLGWTFVTIALLSLPLLRKLEHQRATSASAQDYASPMPSLVEQR